MTGPYEKKTCVHHWMIDNKNIGRCKKCGEIRDFKKVEAEMKPKYTGTNLMK
jgi:hypothetical protein